MQRSRASYWLSSFPSVLSTIRPAFYRGLNEMVGRIKQAYLHEENIVKNDELRSRVQALGEGV